jgi:hypothetical protein
MDVEECLHKLFLLGKGRCTVELGVKHMTQMIKQRLKKGRK